MLLGGTASAICTATFGSNNYIYVSTPCNISEINQAINNDTRMNKSVDGTTVYARYPIQFNATSTFQANTTDNVTILRLVTRSASNQSNLTILGRTEANLTVTSWNETNWTVPDKRIWSLFTAQMSAVIFSGSSATGNISGNWSFLGGNGANPNNFGIALVNTNRFNVTNLTTENNTYGVYITGSSNVSIKDSYIKRSINDGLSYVSTNNNNSVNNTEITGNGRYGLYYESLKDSSFNFSNISYNVNNNIEGNPTTAGTNISFHYNTVSFSILTGIGRGFDLNKWNNSNASHNTINNNSAHGFWCSNCNNSQITDNDANFNYYANYYFAYNSSYLNISGNMAFNSSGGNDCGIATKRGANNLTITYNNASNNQNAGICTEDLSWSNISYNEAGWNGQGWNQWTYGISLSRTGTNNSNYNTVSYNTVHDNYVLNGMRFLYSNFTRVIGNTVYNHSASGVMVDGYSYNNIFINNNLSSRKRNHWSEYEVNGSTSNTTIQDDYSNFQIYYNAGALNQLLKVEFTDKRLFTSTTNNVVTIYPDNSSQIVKNQTGQHNYTIFNAYAIPATGSVNFTNNTWNTTGDYHKLFNITGNTYVNISTCDGRPSSNYDWKVNGTYLSTNTTNATGCMPPLNLSLNGQTQLEISITIPPSSTPISMADVTETYYSSVEIIFGFIKLLIISWIGAVAFIFIKSIIDKGPIELSIIAYSGVAVGLVGLILLFSVAIMNAVPK